MSKPTSQWIEWLAMNAYILIAFQTIKLSHLDPWAYLPIHFFCSLPHRPCVSCSLPTLPLFPKHPRWSQVLCLLTISVICMLSSFTLKSNVYLLPSTIVPSFAYSAVPTVSTFLGPWRPTLVAHCAAWVTGMSSDNKAMSILTSPTAG